MSRFVMFAAVLGAGGLGVLWAADEAAPETKKGQLPAHYKDIVTPDQKAKIYAVQEDYRVKIEALTAQIKTLQAERDAAYEAVLSAEQREKLAKARAEAAAKRTANSAKKTEPEATPKVEAPAAVPEKPVAPVAPEKPATPAKKPAPAVK